MNSVTTCQPFSPTTYGTKIPCGIAIPWEIGPRTTYEDEAVSETISKLAHEHLTPCQNQEEARARFEELKRDFKDLQYFPKLATPFAQLIYYAQLSEEQRVYSQSTISVFEESDRANRDHTAWLRTAVCCIPAGFAVSFCVPASLPFVAQSAITSFASCAAGFSSWVGTGSNPDDKSDAANNRQDGRGGIERTVQSIAGQLIRLKSLDYFLAAEIANRLNVEVLQGKMQREDPVLVSQRRDGPDLVELEAAKCFVQGKCLPKDTPLAIMTAIDTANMAIEQRLHLYTGTR